jgi:hypothetical protein
MCTVMVACSLSKQLHTIISDLFFVDEQPKHDLV